MDRWQAKVRGFRKSAKGWSANIDAEIRKHKKDLMEEYDSLDVKAENQILEDDERSRLDNILSELNSYWIIEEIKAKQRARDRDIKEGDRNTAYFHAVANQRRRKKLISVLDGPDGPETETKGMLKIAVDFYKDLFKYENRADIRIRDDFFSEEEKVSVEENVLLEQAFSMEEIKEAVFGSYSDGAPGPDGLPFFFYQKYWVIIKEDLFGFFNDWFANKMDIYRINFAMITLIPKEDDARVMKNLDPLVCLIVVLRSLPKF